MIRCSTMWAQKSSSASEPDGEVQRDDDQRTGRPGSTRWRQPGTARAVPASVMGAQRVEDPGDRWPAASWSGDLHDVRG